MTIYTFWVTRTKVINGGDGRNGLLSESVRYFKHKQSAEESLKRQAEFAMDLGIPKSNFKSELEPFTFNTEDEKETGGFPTPRTMEEKK